MKSRVLMASLVITLALGVRAFASECEPCEPVGDTTCAKSCDLFSGLKKLVKGVKVSDCDACDGVVACNPCDEAAECNPCDAPACDDTCVASKFELGSRLRSFFASKHHESECNPCDEVAECNPCDVPACDDVCVAPKFSLRKFFAGFRVNRCATNECNPCDETGAGNCNPCDEAGNCNPCDEAGDCNPCDDTCGTTCAKGYCLDLPRLKLKKFFDSILVGGKCGSECNPCDKVECDPCDNVCAR